MSNLEENARLSHELEEARDTIERLVAEKVGITRQRDEMKRQLTIALEENCELRKTEKRLMEIARDAHDRLLRGDDVQELLSALECAWKERSGIE